MAFDESKVRRDQGRFANQDALRDEADVIVLDDTQMDGREGQLSDEELMQMAARLGRKIASENPNHGESADDLAQEIIERTLISRRNNAAPNGQSAIRSEVKYVQTISRSLAQQVSTHRIHPNNRKALAILRKNEEAFKAANGRSMTGAEHDAEVQRIQFEEFPAGRRPTEGWAERARWGQNVPLMVTSTDGDSEMLNSAVHYDEVSTYQPEFRDAGDHAADERADSFEALSKAKRRATLWMAMSESREDLPAIAKRAYNTQQRAKMESVVALHGGPAGVANKLVEGEIKSTHPAALSLFAPYGFKLRPAEYKAVVKLLRDHPAYADDIWGHCVAKATS